MACLKATFSEDSVTGACKINMMFADLNSIRNSEGTENHKGMLLDVGQKACGCLRN